MSHVVSSSVIIKDLDCLADAVKSMGALLVRNVKKYNWFGEHVGDYPMPAGVTKDQLGKCDHVIRLPGVNYEIGVVKQADGTYRMLFDFYGSGGTSHDGNKLKEHFGDGLSILQNTYNEATIVKTAKSHGFTVTKKVLPNGDIALKAVRTGGVKAYSYQKIGAGK